MRKLHILQIISGLDIGGCHGGAERFGAELALQLAQNQQVELCAFWQHGTAMEQSWVRRLQKAGLTVYFAARWEGANNLGGLKRGLRSLRQRHAKGSLDISHSHFQLGSICAASLKAQGCSRAAIRTAHISREWGSGLYSFIGRQFFTNWIFPLLLDREVAVSQGVYTRLNQRPQGRLNGKKAQLIYNAIRLKDFRAESETRRIESMPGINGRVIGSIGRLTEQKDFETLIQAFGLAMEQVPALKLILIGDGELRTQLQALACELGINRQVQFLGQRMDTAALYQHMELFVLSSRWEGLPTVLLESMAAGVPVIASAIPGCDELVIDRQTGWLVPAGQPQALAKAIVYALRHPDESAGMAQAASRKVTQFSMVSTAAQYEALYADVLK
ncbi:MAG: glycosyltransferase [Anaerolineaceae bacterium]|nr:glycosyltransferase [Anaerolineaceae bacterium]